VSYHGLPTLLNLTPCNVVVRHITVRYGSRNQAARHDSPSRLVVRYQQQ